MKIAITQQQTIINDIVYDCLDPNWYTLLKNHKIVTVPNLLYVDLDVDLLILSGGANSDARQKTELRWYHQAVCNNIPVVGVCHGAFFLNIIFGGTNKQTKNHRNVNHNITMENKDYMVNSYHDVCIYNLGKELMPIAEAKLDRQIEAFKHEKLPIWGIVWHPERMKNPVLPKDLEKILNG
jgi:gamma-glutamyl-gamma-aminobutyrate hydrolase PuuD